MISEPKLILVLLFVLAARSDKYVPFLEIRGHTPGNTFKIPTQLSSNDNVAILLSWTAYANFRIYLFK